MNISGNTIRNMSYDITYHDKQIIDIDPSKMNSRYNYQDSVVKDEVKRYEGYNNTKFIWRN